MGCGSDDASGTTDLADSTQPSAEPAASGSSDDGPCRSLADVDLSAAFGGALEFDDIDEFATGTGCSAAVIGAEGEGLLVQLTIPENYAAKALYEEQDIPFSTIAGLGEEAFIVNDADLNVLIDADTALSVGLSAFFMGDVELPDPAVIEAGLVTIAAAVLAGR